MDTKDKIKELVHQYCTENKKTVPFEKGVTHVPVSGKVVDENDIFSVVESALDGWFTTGRFNDAFEKKLADYIDCRHVLTTNSGSSANLLAVSALTSDELKERAIKPGDEVITVAASFPTTINPWITYGVVPVFVDMEIPYYNIDTKMLEQALSSKTKAIMVAHTLGNPFDVETVKAFADKHNLWLIEDCCDALGARVKGKHVGTFGDIGTLSFYPAHHITMGEGGAVFTSNSRLKKIIESFRDWGRDCWCGSGKDNTCGKRFNWKLGDLPQGYDHKYIYSRIGFNLKITDMQAALGLSQLDKLDGFVATRRKYYEKLTAGLGKHTDKLILPIATQGTEPSWFGFLITIKEDAGFTRNEMIAHLNKNNIGTRLLFAGDLRKQPYFKSIAYREVGTFEDTEMILRNTFWVGTSPLLTEEMIDFVLECFDEFLTK